MMKAIFVPVLVLGLAMGGGAREARALSAEETAALVAGLAIVGLIVSANNSAQAESKRKKKLSDASENGRSRQELLPARCIRQVETRRGVRAFAGERCLDRNGIGTSRLPETCAVSVLVGGRYRDAFSARCLRREGFSFTDSFEQREARRPAVTRDEKPPVIQRRY